MCNDYWKNAQKEMCVTSLHKISKREIEVSKFSHAELFEQTSDLNWNGSKFKESLSLKSLSLERYTKFMRMYVNPRRTSNRFKIVS